MVVLEVLLWVSLALILWTHVGYPLLAAGLARVARRPVRAGDALPKVALVITAHNEADVIAEKLENALALDYPRELLRIVVTSDASSDGTDDIVRSFADRGVELVVAERGGKVNAQDTAMRALGDAIDVVAFSDANSTWSPDALRKLMRPFADPDVAYVCGQLALRRADGTNQEGAYWKLEVALRAQESAIGSITGGNGSIYAVRRGDYAEVDPRWGHDLSFPYLMVKRGRRAVYVSDAVAAEKPSTDLEDEFRRKVRMFGHCWLLVFHGRMFSLRRMGLVYWVQMISHRLLRYGSGVLHLVLLATSVVLALAEGGIYWWVLGAQALFAALVLLSIALRGRVKLLAIPHYYLLVTWATVVALYVTLTRGVPAVWERAEGTR